MVERDRPLHVPSGCPEAVSAPGTGDSELTATAWLLDLIPEYRQYAELRRHPVVLAYIARHAVNGAIEGARQGYRTIRSDLTELVPPHVIDAALRDCRTEGRRLAATARAVELVESELRGERPPA